MADRTTKALLLAIALGLWANIASAWLRPIPLAAQGSLRETLNDQRLSEIASNTKFIAIDTTSMSVSLKALAQEPPKRR